MILERKYTGETEFIPTEEYSWETTTFFVDNTGMASRRVEALKWEILGRIEAWVHMSCSLRWEMSKKNRFYKETLLELISINKKESKKVNSLSLNNTIQEVA